jgi:hypothetical protein
MYIYQRTLLDSRASLERAFSRLPIAAFAMANPPQGEILRKLAHRIDEIERRYRPPRADFSLGIPALADLLPGGRLPAGALVELLGDEGAGVWSLALVMAKTACGRQRALVIVDGQGSFYPPAVAVWGIDWRRFLVVRPATSPDAQAVIDQSLHCAAVGAVIGVCPQLRTREFRRLQLAAESGHGVGFLLRPESAQRLPSFAALRLRVAPLASTDVYRRLHVEVVRCREAPEGRSLILEMNDATGDVRVPASLAAAAPAARPARAAE